MLSHEPSLMAYMLDIKRHFVFPRNESWSSSAMCSNGTTKLCMSLVFRIILDFPAEVAKNLQEKKSAFGY